MQINAYNKSAPTQSAAKSSNKALSGMSGSGSTLGMQDFLNLLASQLANQDVMNPMDDTQFIAQMAQFTSLQTMQTMAEINYAQYGASMVGKQVIVADYNDKGELVKDTGIVQKVSFHGGSCIVTVNDKDYDMSSVMEVTTPGYKPPEPTEPPVEKV